MCRGVEEDSQLGFCVCVHVFRPHFRPLSIYVYSQPNGSIQVCTEPLSRYHYVFVPLYPPAVVDTTDVSHPHLPVHVVTQKLIRIAVTRPRK